jgi:hypothetical protein
MHLAKFPNPFNMLYLNIVTKLPVLLENAQKLNQNDESRYSIKRLQILLTSC